MTGIDRVPGKQGGEPCVAGTRIPVAQLIDDLADGGTVARLAAALGQETERFANALRSVAAELRASRVSEPKEPCATDEEQERLLADVVVNVNRDEFFSLARAVLGIVKYLRAERGET